MQKYQALRAKSGKWVRLDPINGWRYSTQPDIWVWDSTRPKVAEKYLKEPVEIVSVIVMEDGEVPSESALELMAGVCRGYVGILGPEQEHIRPEVDSVEGFLRKLAEVVK
jgi:hypothetical protein